MAKAWLASRRLYLPTVLIAAAAAWLGWQGWSELSEFGLAHSIDAGRFQLAGPAVLGFVLVVFLIEQAFPAVRRPLLARGHVERYAANDHDAREERRGLGPGRHLGPGRCRLTFSSGLANLVLVIEIVAIFMLAITGAVLLRRRGSAAR